MNLERTTRLEVEDDNFLVVPQDNSLDWDAVNTRSALQEIPEATYSSQGYSLPPEYYIVEELKKISGILWTAPARQLAKGILEQHEQEIELQSRPRAEVPFVPQVAKELRAFQTLAVDFGLRTPRFILTLEAGLGKTFTALYIALVRMIQRDVNRTLVILPASAIHTWISELKEIQDISYMVVQRGDKDPPYVSHYSFVLVTYDQLLSHIKRGYVSFQQLQDFDMVIFDDPRRLLNADNVTYKLYDTIFADTPYMITLNATPIENRLQELYDHVNLVHPGYLGEWSKFALRYLKSNNIRSRAVVGEGTLHHKLMSIMFRRNKKDVAIELPPKIYKTVKVALLPEQQAAYNFQLQRLENADMTTMFKAMTRLQQICDDLWLVNKKEHHSQKLLELDYIVESVTRWKSKAILFTQSRIWAEYLAERYDKHGCVLYTGKLSPKQKQYVESKFTTDPSLSLFICTSAGFRAVNLPEVGYVIKLDNMWCNMTQVEDRAHRLNSSNRTTIINVLTDTPFENYKARVVAEKELLQQVVIENLPYAVQKGILSLEELRHAILGKKVG